MTVTVSSHLDLGDWGSVLLQTSLSLPGSHTVVDHSSHPAFLDLCLFDHWSRSGGDVFYMEISEDPFFLTYKLAALIPTQLLSSLRLPKPVLTHPSLIS